MAGVVLLPAFLAAKQKARPTKSETWNGASIGRDRQACAERALAVQDSIYLPASFEKLSSDRQSAEQPALQATLTAHPPRCWKCHTSSNIPWRADADRRRDIGLVHDTAPARFWCVARAAKSAASMD